jgi:hypothetical protein
MSHCLLRLLILLWSPGEGSEVKTRRPELISSQVGNPIAFDYLFESETWFLTGLLDMNTVINNKVTIGAWRIRVLEFFWYSVSTVKWLKLLCTTWIIVFITIFTLSCFTNSINDSDVYLCIKFIPKFIRSMFPETKKGLKTSIKLNA